MSGAVEIVSPGPLAVAARAIRARLEIAFPPRLFAYQWMPARLTRPAWKQLTRRTPMVGLGFNQLAKAQGAPVLSADAEWSVYLAVKNEAGQEAVLFGDRFAPGLFDLAGVGAAALNGLNVKGAGTVLVESVANSFFDEDDDPNTGLVTIDLRLRTLLGVADVLSGDGTTPATIDGASVAWSFSGGTGPDWTDTINGEAA